MTRLQQVRRVRRAAGAEHGPRASFERALKLCALAPGLALGAGLLLARGALGARLEWLELSLGLALLAGSAAAVAAAARAALRAARAMLQHGPRGDELRAARAALESAARASETAFHGIGALDTDGRFRQANAGYAQLAGLALSELVGRPLSATVLPEDRPQLDAAFARMRRDGRALVDVRGLRPDGGAFHQRLTLVEEREPGREASLVHVFAADTTELRERERALARFAKVVESAREIVLGTDGDGLITSWNPAAERAFGIRAGEALGRRIDFLFAPDEQPLARSVLDVLEEGPEELSFETRWTRGDGRPLEVSVSVAAIRDEGGERVGLSAIAMDVSERKALERIKDDFVATITHELRTPLATIRGYLELVLEGEAGELAPEQRRLLENADQGRRRLESLVDDLLDLEELRSGSFQFAEQRLDLGDVLREAVRAFEAQAARKGLKLVLDADDPLPVLGDPERLLRVFSNLVSNAVKYTPAGRVDVRARAEGEGVVVSVSDSGIGMDPDEFSHLFTPFFRGHDAVVRAAVGTGLGLVIAKQVVDGHGGRIEVETQKGRGTTFRVSLPRGRAAEAA